MFSQLYSSMFLRPYYPGVLFPLLYISTAVCFYNCMPQISIFSPLYSSTALCPHSCVAPKLHAATAVVTTLCFRKLKDQGYGWRDIDTSPDARSPELRLKHTVNSKSSGVTTSARFVMFGESAGIVRLILTFDRTDIKRESAIFANPNHLRRCVV